MRIDLNQINREQFTFKDGLVGDYKVFLINPNHNGTGFNQGNKFLRSSLWTEHGELISASFPKFMNMGQDEVNFPSPIELIGTQILDKLDGSTLIFSIFKGNLIIRTRGCLTPEITLANGNEIELFRNKYIELFNYLNEYIKNTLTMDFSIICEWVSPNNQIVIKYNEPELYLTGIIVHENYSLTTQVYLDFFADKVRLKRPQYHTFTSLFNLCETVKAWPGNMEGVCLYYNYGQSICKVKGEDYLRRHFFKSNLSFNNLIDLFFEYKCPDFEGFKSKIIENFDYECMRISESYLFDLTELYKKVISKIVDLNLLINNTIHLNQKSFALLILKDYTSYSPYLFTLKKCGVLSDKEKKRLLLEMVKI